MMRLTVWDCSIGARGRTTAVPGPTGKRKAEDRVERAEPKRTASRAKEVCRRILAGACGRGCKGKGKCDELVAGRVWIHLGKRGDWMRWGEKGPFHDA